MHAFFICLSRRTRASSVTSAQVHPPRPQTRTFDVAQSETCNMQHATVCIHSINVYFPLLLPGSLSEVSISKSANTRKQFQRPSQNSDYPRIDTTRDMQHASMYIGEHAQARSVTNPPSPKTRTIRELAQPETCNTQLCAFILYTSRKETELRPLFHHLPRSCQRHASGVSSRLLLIFFLYTCIFRCCSPAR